MFYIKFLELFLLKTLFAKDEYKFTNKNFNPIKFFIIVLLTSNLFFTFYLLNKINNIYEVMKKECPSSLEKKKT